MNASIASHLADRLGQDTTADALERRLAERLSTGAYAAVVAPRDAEGVAAALALCAEEGWRAVAAGAGTRLPRAGSRGRGSHTHTSTHTSTGGSAEAKRVLISTMKLDRVLEHEPADLVIGVEAGLPIGRLREVLVAAGQYVPLDPAVVPESTIGATAALGSAGPLRAGHGTPRDMMLGLQVATGDGRLLSFGGRVVKNVAGYDGVRLLVGSAGRLGIITRLWLRVRGAPRSDRTVALDCGTDVRRAADAAVAVRDALPCDAIELLSPRLAERIGAGSAGRWTLLVRLLGGEEAVRDGVERVRGAATGAGAAGGAEVQATVWSELTRAEAAGGAELRLTTLPTGLGDLLAAVEPFTREGRECGAHAADGIVRLRRPDADPDATVWNNIVGAGTAAGARHQGGAEADPVVAALAERVRRVFDPGGVMAEG